MPLPPILQRVRFPLFGAPMFIVSTPRLVIAQCTSGIVGAMPALNARPASQLDEWIAEIKEALGAWDAANPERPAAPFAINQIVHRTNDRIERDLEVCAKHGVPIVITSMGARPEVNAAVHGWGGIVLHDVIDNRYAHKAIDKGADGLVLVTAGAGGHGGTRSPFALVQEVRAWFDGPVALAGAIATGAGVLAAQCLGADFAYVGSAFIATTEARADDAYKRCVVDSTSDDIVYTDHFSGVHGNYLAPSIRAAGLDPGHLPAHDPAGRHAVDYGARPWREIWGSGQGIGAVRAIVPAAERIAQFEREYRAARERMGFS